MQSVNKAKQIVVVDDDLDIQELITAYFKPKGYLVTCYSDAESVIKDSKKLGHVWDVILADLSLPQMSGIELAVFFKETLPHVPTILITANKAAETAIEAIQKGAYDFIVKPIHFSQLQVSVERALHFRALNNDIVDLREEVKQRSSATIEGKKIVGKSSKFLAALDIAKRVAPSTANIFINGESGTGKEVFAKFIHTESKRQGAFVAINCSAIPENLLESELFGHAKGAFTGASDKKIGLFEEAENGTLFLDEIGDLSLALQAKLLRVLQEKKIKRVGENQDREINCRIISATHKDLVDEVRNGKFREDLYFRLNVIPVKIPALREREEDILPLAEMFLRKFALQNGVTVSHFSKEAIKYILENPWRGNVRELENSVERAVVLSTGPEISLDSFLPTTPSLDLHSQNHEMNLVSSDNMFVVKFDGELPSLNDITNKYIEFAVEKHGGARDKTAKAIGIDRKTLYKRLKSEEGTTISSALQ